MTQLSNVGPVLRGYIERVEHLEEERASVNADIREVYAEAKGAGFDVKTMREVVKLRKLDKDDRDEQRTLLDMYLRAMGLD